ncbi:MAG: HupE/UreJ family protein [Parasulfuritortus sp.]|nr:HupE/UreJ family protein [Parasulfuritortus sp.]
MTRNVTRTIATITCLVVPGLAFAHLGNDAGLHHGTGFLAGFLHPFTGLDHLSAMVAVGIWSAMTTRRIWLAPIAFASMLGMGAVLGSAGMTLSGVEPMIAVSLLILGLLVATRIHLPSLVGAALVGGLALYHGIAHGTELAGAASFVAALAGMLTGTMLLHMSGIGMGLVLKSGNRWWPRILGGSVALFGALLLAGIGTA